MQHFESTSTSWDYGRNPVPDHSNETASLVLTHGTCRVSTCLQENWSFSSVLIWDTVWRKGETGQVFLCHFCLICSCKGHNVGHNLNKWLFHHYQSKTSNFSIRKGNHKNQGGWGRGAGGGGGGGWLSLFRLSTLLNLSTTNSENWLNGIDIAGARTMKCLTNVLNSSRKSGGNIICTSAI